MELRLKSVVTCPNCGHKKEETMPIDEYVTTYTCEACKITLRKKSICCCVYCSYGNVPCPSIQKEQGF